jgi:hypothetical protein
MGATARSWWLSALLGLALLAPACLSPTLPLPPPEEPDSVELADDGVWHVRGSCTSGALVLVQNLATGAIDGIEDKDADGRYFLRVPGELCDPAEVFEVIDNDTSDRTPFLLEPTLNGLPTGECR